MAPFLTSSAWPWGHHQGLQAPPTQWLAACPQSQRWHGTATLGPGTSMLWDSCARWAGRSLAGPHPPWFAPELHLHLGPCWATCQCVCAGHAPCWSWPWLDFQACPRTCPIPMDLPGDLGYGWPWYHHWTCSSLLAGVPWSCILCVWGHCHASHAAPPAPSSLHPVAQLALLLPDIQFHNSFNRSKLQLLKAHFCPWDHLPPLSRLWYLSNFQELR